MMSRLLSLLVFCVCCMLPWASFAQTPTSSKAPVEITADDAIEWLRDAHLYRARGRAIVKQGDTTIHADVIEAAYDPALGEQNIQTVTATGHVLVTNTDRTITADQGTYNMTTGELLLTGSNLKITSPTMTVTAQRSLAYDRNQNKASARGHAIVTTPERTLQAEQIDAWFDANNQLSRAAARDHVLIKTAKEILQADQADYNITTQQAVMVGNVHLTQGENHLQGARATVNLKTGVSQLFGADNPNTASDGGRVQALFFPGSDKKVVSGNTTSDMIPMRPGDSFKAKPGASSPTSANTVNGGN